MRMNQATRVGLLVLTLLFAACREEKKPPAADFFLVVDTSGSMAVKTMDRVKEKLPSILASAHVGDRVRLIRFDEKAELVLDTTLAVEGDRQKIESAILGLKPQGRYTDMRKLLEFLQKAVAEPAPGPRYVIVLSDGVDDPAPLRNRREKRARVDLRKYESAEKLPVQEPFIFYVHLGDAGTEPGLRENLKDLSHDVKVVRPEGKDVGVETVKAQIESGRQPADAPWYRKALAWVVGLPRTVQIGAVAGLLVLLLLVYMIFLRKKRPLEGRLFYWESSDHPSMAREVKLEKFRRNDVTIGSASGSLVRIKDATFPARLRLKAKGKGPNFHFGAAKKDLQRMVFLVQKKPGRVSAGDSFRINNYTFEYTHGSKKQGD